MCFPKQPASCPADKTFLFPGRRWPEVWCRLCSRRWHFLHWQRYWSVCQRGYSLPVPWSRWGGIRQRKGRQDPGCRLHRLRPEGSGLGRLDLIAVRIIKDDVYCIDRIDFFVLILLILCGCCDISDGLPVMDILQFHHGVCQECAFGSFHADRYIVGLAFKLRS